MGVQVTLKDIQSGFLTATQHTANNTLIEAGFDKTLDRTANVNNAMAVNFDMGLNKVINQKAGVANTDGATVGQVNQAISGSSSGFIASQIETAVGSDASGQRFTLSGITFATGTINLTVHRNGNNATEGKDYTVTAPNIVDWIGSFNSTDFFKFTTNTQTTNNTTTTAAVTHTEYGSTVNLETYLQNQNVVNVEDFGAVLDGVTDDSVSIQNALNAHDYVLISAGSSVAVSTMITINAGKTLELGANVTVERKSSLTSDVTPVIWVKETGATLIGTNRNDSQISTQNKSPQGIVRVGLEDLVETGRVVRHCRVEHLRVNGNTGDGQTSGNPDIAVWIPTKAAEVNYYHTIRDIFCTDVNHGIFAEGESNGHQVSDIYGESMGNSGLEGNLLYWKSGSDCSVNNVFMSGNGSGGTGATLLKFEASGTSRSTHNSFTGLVGENGVSGKLVVSTETGSLAPVSNIISGIDNTGGINVNSDFFDGNTTTLNDFPSTKGGFRFPSVASLASDLNTLDYYAESQSYTLTPAIQPSNAAASQVTNITTSSWSRVGNRVSFELELDLTTLGTGNGDIQITNGLEFSAARDTIVNVGQFSGIASNIVSISAMCKAGSKDIQLRAIAAAATADAILDWPTFAAVNMAFTITGEYTV